MKKFLFIAASALIATAAYAQDAGQTQNVGLDQFASYSPASGPINLAINESGITSIQFSFHEDAEVVRDKNHFVTLKRNGEIISNVPASNTVFIKFDNVFTRNWQLSFFSHPTYECTAGGNYEVSIPEGFFLIGADKTPNSDIVINYTIESPAITIFPPVSRECTVLQDFTVTFGKAKSVELNPNAEHIMEIFDLFNIIPDEANAASAFAAADDDDDDDDDPTISGTTRNFPYELSFNENSVNIHLLEAITTGSTYCVDIPAGFFYLYDENGNKTESPEGFFQYGIPLTGNGQPEIENVQSLVIDFPGVIELNLPADSKLFFINNMGKCTLSPINEDGTVGEPVAGFRAASLASDYYKESSNATKVFLVNELGEDVRICPAPGLYQLKTADRLYMMTGSDGKMINVSPFTYTFEVIDGNLFDMEFTPENGSSVESIDEIKVKFPYADEIKVEYATAWLRSSTTSYQFYPQGNTADNIVRFTTSVPVTMPGNYRFTSDLKSVNIDGDYVGIVADFKVNEASGVGELKNVVVLPESFDIFNAQGMIIMHNADINDLNALPAGIYIAGGKKIVNR